MRKYCLSFLLICLFFSALVNAGHTSFVKNTYPSSKAEQLNQYSASFFIYPHTELEVEGNQSPTGCNSTYRLQSFFDDFTTAARAIYHAKSSSYPTKENKVNFFFKEYLLYIYPSHNFW